MRTIPIPEWLETRENVSFEPSNWSVGSNFARHNEIQRRKRDGSPRLIIVLIPFSCEFLELPLPAYPAGTFFDLTRRNKIAGQLKILPDWNLQDWNLQNWNSFLPFSALYCVVGSLAMFALLRVIWMCKSTENAYGDYKRTRETVSF